MCLRVVCVCVCVCVGARALRGDSFVPQACDTYAYHHTTSEGECECAYKYESTQDVGVCIPNKHVHQSLSLSPSLNTQGVSTASYIYAVARPRALARGSGGEIRSGVNRGQRERAQG